MIISGAITSGQSGPWINGNEGILHIPQSSKTGVSLSDGLILYPKHLLFFLGGGSYPFADMQLVRSKAPTHTVWAVFVFRLFLNWCDLLNMIRICENYIIKYFLRLNTKICFIIFRFYFDRYEHFYFYESRKKSINKNRINCNFILYYLV